MAEPRAFVCGSPIAHSRSPLIHNHWLRRLGLPGKYERVLVEPEELESHLRRVRVGEFVGGNVTIPHKERAFELVDRHDEAASHIGAVNTVWMDGNVLVGGNTDAYGYAANLDDQAPGWASNGPALVIGAGGAARAVVHALRQRGVAPVHIANRTTERALELAAAMGSDVFAHSFEDLQRLAMAAGLIVNTTAIGLHGEGRIPLDFSLLDRETIISDIVYVPLETPFLAEAQKAGLRTSDGLGMLLHQAVPGFARWFGQEPAVDAELRSLIVADIETRR